MDRSNRFGFHFAFTAKAIHAPLGDEQTMTIDRHDAKVLEPSQCLVIATHRLLPCLDMTPRTEPCLCAFVDASVPQEQEGEIEVRRQEQPRQTIVRAFARSPGIRRAFNRFTEATKSAHRISLHEESDSVVIERCYL